MGILDFMPTGEINAVESQMLAAACGFKSVRLLQKEIERLRNAGHIICSASQPPGGYFYPGNELELRAYIKTIESRAKNSLKSLHSARQALRNFEGQISLE